MSSAAKDFNQPDSETPRSIVVMPIQSTHIDELLGLSPLGHGGENHLKHREYFEDYISVGLVALESASKAHPRGRVVGYALLGKNPVLDKAICISNIFVHQREDRKADYLEQLLRCSARVCLANGQDKMDLMVSQNDILTMVVCFKHEAAITGSNKPGEIPSVTYTISDLSGKFGYGAEKKARELKP